MTTPTDLIGTPLTEQEIRLLALYREAKDFSTDAALAPATRAAVLTALAPLAVAVTELGIEFEHLVDYGA